MSSVATASKPVTTALPRRDELRYDVADLPRTPAGLRVDGFTPSMLSRMLDLLARFGNR